MLQLCALICNELLPLTLEKNSTPQFSKTNIAKLSIKLPTKQSEDEFTGAYKKTSSAKSLIFANTRSLSMSLIKTKKKRRVKD